MSSNLTLKLVDPDHVSNISHHLLFWKLLERPQLSIVGLISTRTNLIYFKLRKFHASFFCVYVCKNNYIASWPNWDDPMVNVTATG